MVLLFSNGGDVMKDDKTCKTCRFFKQEQCHSLVGEVFNKKDIDLESYRNCWISDINHFIDAYQPLTYKDWFYYTENPEMAFEDVEKRLSNGQWEDQGLYNDFLTFLFSKKQMKNIL